VALEQGINLTFEQVYYAYEAGSRTALQGASFNIKAGERIALVGASGAGKSTVARLLLRFIRPTAGLVTVNNISLAQLSEQEWRRMVAYIPQQPYLFYGTVAENITMGCTKATQAEIVAAAEQAGAHGFIEKLPCGYDTVLGDGGRQLSGGQGQLIAIARVFLKNAPFVIMDEPTTGLDSENENVVMEAVTRLAQNRTTLIIAHRLKTVVLADRIIVLDQGRVAEEGEHAELIKRRGAYYRLITAARGRS
jgi:ATP-binding cassette subfamily C protein CydD